MSKSIKDQCNYKYVQGSRKNEFCNKPCRGNRCKMHKLENLDKQKEYREKHKQNNKNLCEHIFTKGDHKGETCNKKCIDNLCCDHKINKKEYKKKYDMNQKKIRNTALHSKATYFDIYKVNPTEGRCFYEILKGNKKGEFCMNSCRGDRCKLHKEYYLKKKKEYNNTDNIKYNKIKKQIDNCEKIDYDKYVDMNQSLEEEISSLIKKINGIELYLEKINIDVLFDKFFVFFNRPLFNKIKRNIKEKNKKKYDAMPDKELNDKVKKIILDKLYNTNEDNKHKHMDINIDINEITLPYEEFAPSKYKDKLKIKQVLQNYINRKERLIKKVDLNNKIIRIIK